MCAKLALKLFLNLSVLRVIHGADLLSSLKDTVSVRQSHCLAAHCQLFPLPMWYKENVEYHFFNCSFITIFIFPPHGKLHKKIILGLMQNHCQ